MQSVVRSSEHYMLVELVGNNADFHGRTGFNQTDADLGGWPWTDLCPAGKTYSGGDWMSGGGFDGVLPEEAKGWAQLLTDKQPELPCEVLPVAETPTRSSTSRRQRKVLYLGTNNRRLDMPL